MTTRRKENWQSAMTAFLSENRARAFVWGEWDCCLSALAHVDAITLDNSYYGQYAGRWSDLRSAIEAIEALGGYEQAVTDVFGQPLEQNAKAQRGDLVLFDSGQGPALGFIGLDGIDIMAVALDTPGFSRIQRGRMLRAWRI